MSILLFFLSALVGAGFLALFDLEGTTALATTLGGSIFFLLSFVTSFGARVTFLEVTGVAFFGEGFALALTMGFATTLADGLGFATGFAEALITGLAELFFATTFLEIGFLVFELDMTNP